MNRKFWTRSEKRDYFLFSRFIYLPSIVCLLVLSACTDSFTPSESQLIREKEGIMRVWKIDNREDSLLLRKIAQPLEKKALSSSTYQKLKERMLATVNDPADPGVGIAAPQVGISRALVAVQRYDKPGEPFEFYINPKIEAYSEEKSLGPEGCLSVPEVMDSVWRSNEITISYLPDLVFSTDSKNEVRDFQRKTEQVKGFTAVIFQHEIDHLNGILFIDRVREGH